MRTTFIALGASTVTASNQLFNLRNHHVLEGVTLTPFETIAHLETFDPIPVFGGQEHRQRMLEQQRGTDEKLNQGFNLEAMGLARDIQRGFTTVSKTVGCSIG